MKEKEKMAELLGLMEIERLSFPLPRTLLKSAFLYCLSRLAHLEMVGSLYHDLARDEEAKQMRRLDIVSLVISIWVLILTTTVESFTVKSCELVNQSDGHPA